METISVDALSKIHGRHTCQISHSLQRPVEVSISSPQFGKLNERGDTLFDALINLRLLLEKRGWILLCNVARKDAFPSQMMLQMALGRKIYILKRGMPARRENVVDIFDQATPEQVGTVQEQKEFHESWIRSLGSS